MPTIRISPSVAQSGFSLIEVLITLFILLVGLLGLAGMMVQGQRSEMESYQRVQAQILLQDMAARINANRAVASCYIVTTGNGTPFLGTGIATTGIVLNPNCVGQATFVPKEGTSTTTAFCNTAGACAYLCRPRTNAPLGTCPNAAAQPLAQPLAAAMINQGSPTALADLKAWNDLLLGAAETQGLNQVGAMVGARGCISYNPASELIDQTTGTQLTGTGVYTVQVAWQGLGDSFVNAISTCGQGQYGPESRRRVSALNFRIANLN